MRNISFGWSFDEKDLLKAQTSRETDGVFGLVRVSTPGSRYLVDIRRECRSRTDRNYCFDVYREDSEGNRGTQIGCIRTIRDVRRRHDSLRRFRAKAEKGIADLVRQAS